ncbi:MAG TPA: hypothetical protein VMU25_00950 [Candidatus Paceibacterota bacterium]|nr:hypothetical protein [Candidatus Paceibacterota bacterium]
MNNSRPLVWIGAFVGSTVGSMIPSLWGAGFLSFSSILLSGIGAIAGIYFGFKISQNL